MFFDSIHVFIVIVAVLNLMIIINIDIMHDGQCTEWIIVVYCAMMMAIVMVAFIKTWRNGQKGNILRSPKNLVFNAFKVLSVTKGKAKVAYFKLLPVRIERMYYSQVPLNCITYPLVDCRSNANFCHNGRLANGANEMAADICDCIVAAADCKTVESQAF
uniref:Uncharacterized protein n=1 Tax=Glossina palpalis gambiensis TaxID=67801 RepID=A0A1B0AWP0_9MUSC